MSPVFPVHLCFDIVRQFFVGSAYLARFQSFVPAVAPALHLDSYHVVAPKQQTNTRFQDLRAIRW